MRGLVKLSNFVAAASILLLIYWVFIFILVEVFGLKVFRENLSQTFGLSVMGILALMAGSLMINVMFNMTRIANKQEGIEETAGSKSGQMRKLGIVLLVLFPLITAGLFGGDYLTSKKKEAMLVNAARSVINKNPERMDGVVDFRFEKNWIVPTGELVELLRRTDKYFPNVSIIVSDFDKGTPVFLQIDHSPEPFKPAPPRQSNSSEEKVEETVPVYRKKDFLFPTSSPERKYLDSVFKNGNRDYRFSASDGSYELFYPYFKGDKKIVIYFSEQQRYGKLGS